MAHPLRPRRRQAHDAPLTMSSLLQAAVMPLLVLWLCAGAPTPAAARSVTDLFRTGHGYVLRNVNYLLSQSSMNALQCPTRVKIKENDNCRTIANRAPTNVTLSPDTIISLNPGLICGNLIPGEIVCMSKTDQPTAAGVQANYNEGASDGKPIHCVANFTVPDSTGKGVNRTKTTCESIMHEYKITKAFLRKINPGDFNCEDITPGTILCVKDAILLPDAYPDIVKAPPPFSIVQGCQQTMAIHYNDSCDALTHQYNLKQTDLTDWNKGIACGYDAGLYYYVGKLLCIKGPQPKTSSLPPTPTPTTTSTQGAQSSAPPPPPPPTTTEAPPPQPSAPSGDQFGCSDAHNIWRRQLGSPDVAWDQSLADYSQSISDSLASQGCGLSHGDRTTENLAETGGSRSDWCKWAVNYWMTEGYDSCSGYNHASQVEWSTATKIGCAQSYSSYYGCQVVTCHYDEGNLIGERAGAYFHGTDTCI